MEWEVENANREEMETALPHGGILPSLDKPE